MHDHIAKGSDRSPKPLLTLCERFAPALRGTMHFLSPEKSIGAPGATQLRAPGKSKRKSNILDLCPCAPCERFARAVRGKMPSLNIAYTPGAGCAVS
jgi:hypothetical protein